MKQNPFIHFYLPVIIALLLVSPSLFNGLQLDDYFHWGLVTQNPLAVPGKDVAGIFGLFTFLDGDPQRTQLLIDRGMLPWWTLPEVKYAFWRPVAEITHGIDYLLWPQQPVLMHLHSLVYLFFLLWVTHRLLRRWLSSQALQWAFWVFALSYTHGFAAGWLANRNAILATLFVALTLYCHDKWRESQRTRYLIYGLMAFLLGLLSGELGVSAGLFLFAYALCMESRLQQTPVNHLGLSLIQRMLTIVPYGVVGVLWLLARSLMNYGAEGSGHYVDPANLPAFIQIVSERYWQLLTGLFWSLPPEFAELFGQNIPLLVSVIGGLLLLLVLTPVLKIEPVARFFLLSLLIMLLPVCATTPHSRLLIVASIPFAGLAGIYFALPKKTNPALPVLSRKLAPALSLLLAISLLVVAPVFSVLESVAMKLAMDGVLNKGALNLQIPEDQQDKVHVILNTPLSSAAGYIQGVRAYHGLTTAKAVIPLSSALQPVEFTRLNERTFSLKAEQGLYQAAQENLLRAPDQPMRVGQQVAVAGIQAQVKALTDQGIPSLVEFTLPENQTGYVFHLWHKGQPVVCPLPVPGTSISLTQDRDSCGQ